MLKFYPQTTTARGEIVQPNGTCGLDILHVILLTGFVSFVSGVASHVLTKYRLSGRFVPASDFYKALDGMMQKMIDHCEITRRRSPFDAMVEDIKDIKEVQRMRTDQLSKRHARDDEIWRIVMTKLSVSVEEQNRLLAGVNL